MSIVALLPLKVFMNGRSLLSRLQGVRYGQGRLHLEWRAFLSVEDDGGQ